MLFFCDSFLLPSFKELYIQGKKREGKIRLWDSTDLGQKKLDLNRWVGVRKAAY